MRIGDGWIGDRPTLGNIALDVTKYSHYKGHDGGGVHVRNFYNNVHSSSNGQLDGTFFGARCFFKFYLSTSWSIKTSLSLEASFVIILLWRNSMKTIFFSTTVLYYSITGGVLLWRLLVLLVTWTCLLTSTALHKGGQFVSQFLLNCCDVWGDIWSCSVSGFYVSKYSLVAFYIPSSDRQNAFHLEFIYGYWQCC